MALQDHAQGVGAEDAGWEGCVMEEMTKVQTDTCNDRPRDVEAEIRQHLTALQSVVCGVLGIHYQLANVVLCNPAFQVAPGSSKHHHAYRGGLIQHTWEVVSNIKTLTGQRSQLKYFSELLLAAIWHDYHKIHEYRIEADGSVTKLDYLYRIGHVVGSYAEFCCEAGKQAMPQEQIHTVGHIMLAHHGRREWGSAVEPQTPEAFILHAADMMSARGS